MIHFLTTSIPHLLKHNYIRVDNHDTVINVYINDTIECISTDTFLIHIC